MTMACVAPRRNSMETDFQGTNSRYGGTPRMTVDVVYKALLYCCWSCIVGDLFIVNFISVFNVSYGSTGCYYTMPLLV